MWLVILLLVFFRFEVSYLLDDRRHDVSVIEVEKIEPKHSFRPLSIQKTSLVLSPSSNHSDILRAVIVLLSVLVKLLLISVLFNKKGLFLKILPDWNKKNKNKKVIIFKRSGK